MEVQVEVQVEVMGRGALRRLFLWGLGHGFDSTLFGGFFFLDEFGGCGIEIFEG